jgi:hypothetical protein
MNRRLIAMCIATLGAALFVSPANAQRGFGGAPIGRTGTAYSRGGGRFVARSSFAPYFFYPGYDLGPEAIEEPPPQIIIMQAPQPVAPVQVRTSPGALVIELQGDHWVRVTNSGQSQTEGQSSASESARASDERSALPPAAPSAELAPAVLVFRDGHTEEIEKYLIVGSTIYANSDYWTSGSWTRKVQISQIDVPATLKLNRERGANFSLPSGPAEVIVRP